MIFLFGELGDGGKLVRILGRQLELAALAADDVPCRSASMRSLSSVLSRRIEPNRPTGRTAAPGVFDFDARHLDADADFQVGGQQRAAFGGHFELDVLQDWLGAAAGATAAAV